MGSCSQLGVLAMAGVITWFFYRFLPSGKTGPHEPRKDFLATTDAELQKHFEVSRQANQDPFLAWYHRAHGKRMELVPVGLQETTDRPIVPENYSAAQYVERLVGTIEARGG